MTIETKPQIQGIPIRDQASSAIGHPFAVFAQGDLPARADFERLGCVREAALRGARQSGACWAADTLAVTLIPDAAAGTLTVKDNGIGMSRDEVIDNLGTIARSGTKKLSGGLERRFGQGCAADRAVRRRVSIRRSSSPTASPCMSKRADCRGGALGLGRRGDLRDPASSDKADRGTEVILHSARGGQGVPRGRALAAAGAQVFGSFERADRAEDRRHARRR